MNQILQKISAEMKKRKEITAAAIGLLVVALLSVSVFGTLSTQEAAAMENPVQGISEESLLIPLTGTKEVLAQAPKGESLETDEQDNANEAEDAQEDNSQDTDRASTASGAGRDSSAQSDSGRDGGSQGNNANNKGDNPSKDPSENKDLDDNGEKEEYFKTSIVDGETITEQTLKYSITHLTDLKVKQVQNKVNDSSFSDYDGELKLAVGKNTITVRVTYLGTDGKTFSVAKSYTIYVDIENIVISVYRLQDGQTIDKDYHSFIAYARQGGEAVDLQIRVENSKGEESYTFSEESVTLEDLAEGENKIYISAEKDGQRAEAPIYPYTLRYEKPDSEKFHVVSKELERLNGTTVYKKTLQFDAQGFRGSTQVSLDVEHDGWVTLAPEEHTDIYTTRLEEGVNTITVTPYDESGRGDPVAYTVTFTVDPSQDPDGEGGDPEKYLPTISCSDLDAQNGQTVMNSPLTFMFTAQDYEGYPIETGNMWVICNGIQISPEWADPGKASYAAALTPGAGNIITIKVEDGEGHQASSTYSVNYEPQDPDRPIGSITLSVEAGTIGMGYLFGPQAVEIRQNESFADVLARTMEAAGYWCDGENSGSDYYLRGIGANYNFVTPSIPADLAEIMQGISDNAAGQIFYPQGYSPNYLGEFDFSSGSGWMYSINGRYPNYSMGVYTPQNGDVVRVRFTLYYGSDIGGAGALSNGGNNSGSAEGFGKEW